MKYIDYRSFKSKGTFLDNEEVIIVVNTNLQNIKTW